MVRFASGVLVLIVSLFTFRSAEADCSSVYDIVCSTDEFKILCEAINKAGLQDALKTTKMTLFAPTDAAVASLGLKVEELLGSDLLDYVLKYHVSTTVLSYKDLSERCTSPLTMLNGEESWTMCKLFFGKWYQKGICNSDWNWPRIIGADIDACNGVIHKVDEVLLPYYWCHTKAPTKKPTPAPVKPPTKPVPAPTKPAPPPTKPAPKPNPKPNPKPTPKSMKKPSPAPSVAPVAPSAAPSASPSATPSASPSATPSAAPSPKKPTGKSAHNRKGPGKQMRT